MIESLIISQKEVDNLFDMKEAVDETERLFKAVYANKDMQPSGYPGPEEQYLSLPTEYTSKEYGFPNFVGIHFGYVPYLNTAGVLQSPLFKGNVKRSYPTVQAVLVLIDDKTGSPLGIIADNAAKTTAVHATVAAKYLAKKDSKILTIVGSGAQGIAHAEGMNILFNLEEIRVCDIRKEALDRAVVKLSKSKANIIPFDKPEDAVKNADIICVATTSLKSVIFENWIKPGSFIIPVAQFTDTEPLLSKKADKWVLGYKGVDKKYCIDLSEQRWGVRLEEKDVYGELTEIVAGKIPGRQKEDERIVYTHTGMGSHSVAMGYLIYKKALQKNAGKKIKLF